MADDDIDRFVVIGVDVFSATILALRADDPIQARLQLAPLPCLLGLALFDPSRR